MKTKIGEAYELQTPQEISDWFCNFTNEYAGVLAPNKKVGFKDINNPQVQEQHKSSELKFDKNLQNSVE